MAKAILTLGGELDIASGAELAAGFSDLKRHNQRLYAAKEPIYRPLMGSIPAALAGTNTAYFAQTPPYWAEWHVLSYAIGMNDDHTTGANSSTSSATASGTSTNPGANGVITSIGGATISSLAPVGTPISVTWQVGLQGTVTAADANNMKLTSPLNAAISNAIYPGVVGNFPQNGIIFTPGSGNGINVQAIGAASGASAVYAAQITAQALANNVVAALYAGDPFNPMLGTVKLPGRSIPDSQNMGPGRIIIHPGEYLFWQFYNVPVGALIWCNMQVAEFSITEREMTRI